MTKTRFSVCPGRRDGEPNPRIARCLLLSTFILVLAVLPECAVAEPLAAIRIGWASMDGTAQQIAKYWRTVRKESDNLTVVTDRSHIYSGNAAVRLTTGETDRALLYQHWTRLGVTPGGRYRVSFQAKGKGTIAACHAAVDADSGRGLSADSLIAGPSKVELKDSWRLISADVIINNPNAALLSCGIELQGRNAVAFIDELNIYRIWDPNWRLEVTPAHPMIPVGGTTQVRLQLSHRGTPQGEQEILLNAALAKTPQSSLKTDDTGVALFQFAGKSPGLFSFSVAHLASGQLVAFHVDVLEQEVYRQFEAVSAKVALKTPAHLLFIGDSITDMQRGHNYVDKVGFWLHRQFGSKVTLKNAGIGGDDITRVWGRMNGNMSQYERERYPEWQPLLAPKPHHVFFSGTQRQQAARINQLERNESATRSVLENVSSSCRARSERNGCEDHYPVSDVHSLREDEGKGRRPHQTGTEGQSVWPASRAGEIQHRSTNGGSGNGGRISGRLRTDSHSSGEDAFVYVRRDSRQQHGQPAAGTEGAASPGGRMNGYS